LTAASGAGHVSTRARGRKRHAAADWPSDGHRAPNRRDENSRRGRDTDDEEGWRRSGSSPWEVENSGDDQEAQWRLALGLRASRTTLVRRGSRRRAPRQQRWPAPRQVDVDPPTHFRRLEEGGEVSQLLFLAVCTSQ
jgi:hypothetical protein